jgi:uncharacterized protein (DUF58 family)
MIPPEILKKIRQIELRTNRLVTETLGGQYHSVFKGQGMNFEEVREYQPGDEVRAIDWNVTARMNHPFIKKFVEERELTLLLVVDASGSGRFGSAAQSKRELAAEIASVLAFSAIRNNDKVGLILFTDEVEKFIPPRKGRRHVLRVIREILFHEPEQLGSNLPEALDFLNRVTSHRAIVVVISDFLDDANPASEARAHFGQGEVKSGTRQAKNGRRGSATLPMEGRRNGAAALRQARRRHDLVCVQVADPRERQLPNVGRLVMEDAETGQVVEVNTGSARVRAQFELRRKTEQAELEKHFRSARVDTIHLQTDQPYEAALGRFFKTREKRRARG